MDEALTRRLRAARAYAGLSQPELAAKLNTSQDTIKRIELGQRELHGYERDGFLRAAAEATGLPVEFFTEDFGRLASMATTPFGQRVLRAGGVYDPETGAVGFNPDHPLYEPLSTLKTLSEKAQTTELSDEEADELAAAATALQAAGSPSAEVERRLARIESLLTDFTATWAEEALPVLFGLLQSGGPSAGTEAAAETDQSTGSRPSERAG